MNNGRWTVNLVPARETRRAGEYQKKLKMAWDLPSGHVWMQDFEFAICSFFCYYLFVFFFYNLYLFFLFPRFFYILFFMCFVVFPLFYLFFSSLFCFYVSSFFRPWNLTIFETSGMYRFSFNPCLFSNLRPSMDTSKHNRSFGWIPQPTLHWKQLQKLRKDGRVHRDPPGQQLAGVASVCRAGGEPSTWFPPERLVEQERIKKNVRIHWKILPAYLGVTFKQNWDFIFLILKFDDFWNLHNQ